MAQERLQKILSRYGVASRRKAEELITAGRVQVNGKTVMELGSKADPDEDDIRVAGHGPLRARRKIYVLLHKPKGCVTTTHDPERRETVMDLVKGIKERIYPVGRLDYMSEGALLLTNDGDLANAIMSAKTQVQKVYEVKVNGTLTGEQQALFRSGIPMHGKRTAPAGLKLISAKKNPWYEVTLTEGRSNQIRTMFQHCGLLVEKLRRTRIGFLELGKLPPAKFRLLDEREVMRFRKLLKLERAD